MPNRLARETSPYLQQHADNPVDWHAWGAEALDLAREHDKPILLSVGYSACHWCHVMAHESFEDPEVAALMNQLFVNIKVDREERPDLDQIYQSAHAMLTQRNGGWPLTMFLTPDQTPFFGGTYFPKTARYGMPGFIDLLPQVAAAYRSKRSEIERQNDTLRDALAKTSPPAVTDGALSSAPLATALRELNRMFDAIDGGIGKAPKFPHPAELEFCLRCAATLHDDSALDMVKLTLTKMAEGGIYDQLGGGFCRYSVDQHWTIPHFEKMLYDNGPLLRLYSDLWCVDQQPLYARTVADTAAWVMREMQSTNPNETGHQSGFAQSSPRLLGEGAPERGTGTRLRDETAEARISTRSPLHAPAAGSHPSAGPTEPVPPLACAGVRDATMSGRHSALNTQGYFSSLDADSEHEEGKFYVWTPDAVKAALTPQEYAVIEPHYGLDAAPNFEQHYWHLRVMKPLAFVAKRLDLPLDRAQALLDAGRAKLLAQRERRVRPGRDDKILTSWNALMIKGMARAARVFDEPAWLGSARAAAELLRTTLWKDGRLLATCRDDKAHLNAYLDDYAFLLDALIELMQSDFRVEDLTWSRELAEVLLAQFEDQEHGGFFFVSHDHERLIHRTKTAHDNATPSGNGVAVFALSRLGHLLGEPRYLNAAERALKAFQPLLERQASAHTSMCVALDEQLVPPTIVILRGPADALREWQRPLATMYHPGALVLALPGSLPGLPATLDKPVLHSAVTAWVCHGVTCLPPIENLAELIATLTGTSA